LSRRTGTPMSSLVTSFLILHEVTAILPFATIFFAAKSYQVGPSILSQTQRILSATKGGQNEDTWLNVNIDRWTKEGEEWVERVGYKYGIFDVDKGVPSSHLSGDVANALAAYLLTKVRLYLYFGARYCYTTL
jgi:Hypothetical protein FLILHELTA